MGEWKNANRPPRELNPPILRFTMASDKSGFIFPAYLMPWCSGGMHEQVPHSVVVAILEVWVEPVQQPVLHSPIQQHPTASITALLYQCPLSRVELIVRIDFAAVKIPQATKNDKKVYIVSCLGACRDVGISLEVQEGDADLYAK